MMVKAFTRISLSIGLLLLPRLLAGVTLVQVNYKTSTSVSSLATAYPSAQTAGNLNIVVVGWNDTTSVVSSITDSNGNTYTRAIGPTAGTALTQSIYYAKNVAAGSNTVTVTFNQAATRPDVRVLEYSGADTANPLDVTAAAVGTGVAPNSGAASTTSLNELIFGAGMTSGAYNAPGSGFTNRVITNFGDIAEDATVASTGLYSATASLRASAPWVMQMATFRGQSAFTVNGISPSSGTTSGGTSVKITGAGFLSRATVTFGGVAGTNVTVANSTTITATTPSHTAATVNVVVANSNGQSGTLTNGFIYTGTSSAGVKFVQVNYMTSTSASSLTTAYSSQQTAGNLNVVAVMWGDTTSTVNSVTDSKGNSYALAVGPTKATGLTSAIYYAKNIASGSNAVTVTFNGTAAYPNVNVLEYSGLDTANPLDVSAAATGSGTTANSGTAPTTSANELIVGAGNPSSGFTAAGSGFSSRMINGFGGISEDRVVSSTGSYNATAALTSGTWVMQMAAFRASGQGSSSNPAPAVTGITPSSGPAGGGTGVTITGTGFLAGATVKLGGTAASNVGVSSTSITATTAAHAAGAVDVVVTNSDGQSATRAGGYTYSAASGGSISFVQVKSTTQTSGTSVAIAYAAAQTAGDLNVVAVMWGDTTSTVSSVTDSNGNSYALAVGPSKATGLTSAIYYAKNIAGGSNTVTVRFNQSAAYPNVNVLEYSGLDTANPLDVSAAATGSGTTANSGTAPTTSANELIVGAGNPSSGFTGAGSGFSSRMINGFGGISEDRVVSSAGSYNATAALTSGTWVMQMAAFRASAGTSAQGPSKHSVSIAWDPSPSTDVAYYNVYRGTVSGGPYSLLGTNIAATAYTDSTVQSGATYFYVTSAVDANREESIYSNEFPAVIPSL